MELKPINHFYNKRIYIVPPYQRGYSWSQKEIYDLLNDIKHAIQLDSDHYTGTITIDKQDKEERIGLSSYTIYNLVDGQQRFTTITLILSYLLKALQDNTEYLDEVKEKENTYIINKGTYLFRYEIDKVSENYFRSIILEHQNLSSLDESLYTRNLKRAKKDIKDYFQQDSVKGKELDFLSAIENKLQFNEYIVKTTSDIGVVFETMNNRGVGLSDLEIVKNRLLYLTSKINLKDDKHRTKNTIDNINSKWSTILRNLTLPDNTLNEDTFLSNHWIIYRGWTKDNQTKDLLLNKHFTIEQMVKDPSKMLDEINKYVNSLAVTSLHWRFINYPSESNAFIEIDDMGLRSQIQIAFQKLNRLSNSTVRPLLLSFIGIMKSKPHDLLELVNLCEIFSFRLFSMNRKRSDTGKADIYRSCNYWHLNNTDNVILAHAKFYMAWYIDNHGDWDRFDYETKELFDSSKKEGYYSWNGLQYFLYEYEENLRNRQDAKLDFDFASKKSKSIEHIIPQDYKQHWKKELAEVKGKVEIKKNLHSLGNLLLITSDKNSSLRNSDYKTKRIQYKNGSYSEIEVATKFNQWTIKSVKKREKDLLDFLKLRWQTNIIFCNNYPNPYEEEPDITDEVDEDVDDSALL
ncbi:DUF262 domain-containing protein [Chryseobacterium aquaticum]|uniref:DUF262 domain-containing protein n=1 Tax=Chryseobacterium aquaticum TaxID=452084 RepID=A0A848NA97_9FLAO|nr:MULTISPECIES: DUF262 domain-containing protein [Chryseobacterium]NMR35480.1 DUF262 domain-containing protein [Chryseobacterium aquaticum]NRQ47556.1 DUF262 domain-containing protein [Chryseobacterium sp. C-204]